MRAYKMKPRRSLERKKNLGAPGRWISAISGVLAITYGAMGTKGLRRLPWFGAGAALVRRGITGYSRLYDLLDVTTYRPNARPWLRRRPDNVIEIERGITINEAPDRVLEVLQDPSLVQAILRFGRGGMLEDGVGPTVYPKKDALNRGVEWRAKLPIVGEVEGDFRVSPAPGDRGTEVTARLRIPPAGAKAVAGPLVKVPDLGLQKALRRLKQMVETGEVTTTSGQPSARSQKQKKGGVYESSVLAGR